MPPKPGRGPIAVRVRLTDGSGFDLTEAGTQKRLAVYITADPSALPGIARLGIDPLSIEFSPAVLAGVLTKAGRAHLKTVLTEQTCIAGIGNAYSDEALWAARLSPFKPAAAMTADDVGVLHNALTTTLRTAVDRATGVVAAELKADKWSAMAVHGRTGQPCPRCGELIRQVSFADRSLQYCAACQTDGRVLADRRLSKLLR